MIYEVCELLATHLQDGAMGVNALRLSVPLDALDPPLEAVTVASEFELEYLAGDKIPDSGSGAGPLVLVRRGDDTGEFSAPGNPELLSNPARVGIAVLVLFPRRTIRDLHLENRCQSALLRVVRRSIGMFFEDVDYAARALRGVQIRSALSVRVVPALALLGEQDLLAGAVLVDVDVIDRWSEGITAS